MKKIILFIFLFCLYQWSVYAEAVVKTPFSGITWAYQLNEDEWIFYRANWGWAAIYDTLWNIIDSESFTSNTDYTNIILPGNRIFSLSYGTQSYNYNRYAQTTLFDLADSSIDFSAYFAVPWDPGAIFISPQWSWGNRYCRTGFKFAVSGGYLYLQLYQAYNNNSSCVNKSSQIVRASIDDATNPDLYFETYSGTVPGLIDTSHISNNYIQVIWDSWMIYTKNGDGGTIYQYNCNEFNVCTESSFLPLDISNGWSIQNFRHIYENAGNTLFWGLNVHVGDGTWGNLQFITYDFWSENEIVWISDAQSDTWISKIELNNDGSYNTYTISPIEMFDEGLDFSMGQNPLLVFDNSESELDFWYVRENELFNFWSTYTGNNPISTESGDNDSSWSGATLWGDTGSDSIDTILGTITSFFDNSVTDYIQFYDISIPLDYQNLYFDVPVISINEQMQLSLESVETQIPEITDNLNVVSFERNESGAKFIAFLLALLYIACRFILIWLIFSLFFLLHHYLSFIFKKITGIDTSSMPEGNVFTLWIFLGFLILLITTAYISIFTAILPIIPFFDHIAHLLTIFFSFLANLFWEYAYFASLVNAFFLALSSAVLFYISTKVALIFWKLN